MGWRMSRGTHLPRYIDYYPDDGFGCMAAIMIFATIGIVLLIAYHRGGLKCEIEFQDGSRLQTGKFCLVENRGSVIHCGNDVYSSFRHLRCQ